MAADMHHTMVTDTAIGECIVQLTLIMAGRATMAVGTEVGVTTEKSKNPGMTTEPHAPLGSPWRGIEFA